MCIRDSFKAMVKKADFKYDQQTEKMLKNLKEMAEFEGYLTDEMCIRDSIKTASS